MTRKLVVSANPRGSQGGGSNSYEPPGAWGGAREHQANYEDAAVAAAEQLGFPVALKVDSPDILHRTEAGVVRLNLGDAAQVRSA